MELGEAIEKRRTIRKFTDHYITDDKIKEIISSARWAPSWANTQVWEFIVIRDRELIKEVTETYSETNPAKKCSINSSAVIVACAKKNISGCKKGEQTTKFSEWFMFDLGMAVQNILLKAHDLGIGSVVVGSLNHDECRKILSLPDEYEVVVAIPLGIPEVEGKKAPARKELRNFVYLDKFGDNFAKIY